MSEGPASSTKTATDEAESSSRRDAKASQPPPNLSTSADKALIEDDLDRTRARIADIMVVASLIVATPVVAVSLVRSLEVGWQGVMFLDLGFLAALALVFVFRKRIHWKSRILVPVIGAMAVAVAGFVSFGLASTGTNILMALVMILAVGWGARAAFGATAAMLVVIAAAGVAITTGMVELKMDLNAYVRSPYAWVLAAANPSALMLVVVLAFREFIRSLKDSHRKLAEKAEGLRKANARLAAETDGRRTAESESVQSKDMYRLLAENVTDVIWTSDLDLHFTYVSPSMVRTSGFTPEETLSMSLDDLVPPDSAAKARRILTEGLASGSEAAREGVRAEFDIRRKDGGTFRAEVTAKLLRDEAGRPTGILGVTRDITERWKAQQSLVESEARFRGIVDATPLGIHLYHLDDDDRLVFAGANPAADEILGIDNWSFVGRTLEDCFPPLADTEVPAAYRRAALEGTPWHTEQVDYEDDRIRGAYDVHAFQTAPRRIAVVFEDVTTRKRAEAALRESEDRFRAVFEESPVGIVLVRDTRFLMANPAFCRMLEYTEHDLRGMTLDDVTHPDDAGAEGEDVRSATPERALAGDKRYVTKSGRAIWTSTTGTRVEGRDGSPSFGIAVVEDITDRRNALMALEESEQRFRAFIEQSDEGVLLTDEDGNIAVWNRAMEKLTGLPLARVVGRPLWDVQCDFAEPCRESSKRRKELRKSVLEAIADGESPLIGPAQELAVKTPDGTRRTIRQTMFAIATDKGRLIGGVATDMTHRKEAEEREEKHRKDLAFLADTAMAFVEWQDGDIHQFAAEMIAEVVGGDAIVAVCERDTETGGFGLKALIGVSRYVKQLTRLLGAPPDKFKADFDPRVIDLMSRGRMLKVEGGIGSLATRYIAMPIATAISKIMNVGETYVIGFVLEREIYGGVVVMTRKGAREPDRDIVEAFAGQASVAFARHKAEASLRMSEQRYRSLFENARIGMVRVDARTRKIVEANDFMAGILGVTGPSALVGTDPTGFIPRDFASLLSRRGGRAGQVVSGELETTRSDGTKSWLQAMAWLAPDKSTIECAVVDVTEARQAQEESRAREEQLVEADKLMSLGTLVAGVAHEINNPNSFVAMNVPLLSRMWSGILELVEDRLDIPDDQNLGGLEWGMVKDRAPKLLTGIHEGSERIRNIVADLKNYARRSPGTYDEDIDLNKVVEAAVALTQSRIKRSTNRFSTKLGEGLPMVKGNFQRLEQVIINLLMNSCEALRAKDRALTITTRHVPDERVLEAVIVDEGVGIPRENLRRIRDPFFTTRREEGGSGLGLSICVSIVEEHEGELLVDSAPGRGTRVTVRLPEPKTRG